MGKRGNGEGSIYPHKRGGVKVGYRGSYWVDTAEGPKRRYITGETREDVAEKLAKAISDRADGLVFDAGSTTTGEYLTRWLSDSVHGTVQGSTYRSYGRVVDGHLVPGVGRVKLAKLRPDHIRRLYRSMLDAGKATRTVQYAHTLLKRACTGRDGRPHTAKRRRSRQAAEAEAGRDTALERRSGPGAARRLG